MSRKSKEHKIRKKSYANLCDFKSEIERDKIEKVIGFNGHTLTTNKHKYGMVDGRIYVDGVLNGTD